VGKGKSALNRTVGDDCVASEGPLEALSEDLREDLSNLAAKLSAIVDTPAEAPAPAEYLNLTVIDTSDAQDRELPANEGLTVASEYRIVVAMGMNPDEYFYQGTEQPRIPRPAAQKVTLDVILAAPENLEIISHSWDTLEWPEVGPSIKNAEFPVKPIAAGPARVKVLLYFENDLLFTGDLTLEVHSEGDVWVAEARPITWKELSPGVTQSLSLFKQFNKLSRGVGRGLNIAVSPGNANSYNLIFFLGSPGKIPGAYPYTFEISEKEIIQFLARTRLALRSFTQKVIEKGRIDPLDSTDFMTTMSTIGYQLWSQFIGGQMGSRLAELLDQHLAADGTTIQVCTDGDSSDFVLPWAWIYPPEVKAGLYQQPDPTQFWGYRFKIEQLRKLPGKEFPDSVVLANPLRIAAALNNFPAAPSERLFFDKAKSDWPGRIEWREVLPEETEAYIQSCEDHLLYFYCHGNTEQPLSPEFIALNENLRKLVSQSPDAAADWLSSRDADERSLLRSQSRITIRRTTLTLADLRRFAAVPAALHPLVFLNMCESAEFYPGATENLIDVFLKRGACGVIGTEVPIQPAFGDEFARGFFQNFFQPGSNGEGQDVGTALWKLRRKYMDEGSPFGFVYTFYGDITTRLRPAVSAAIQSTTSLTTVGGTNAG
jgi:hypothetical protein